MTAKDDSIILTPEQLKKMDERRERKREASRAWGAANPEKVRAQDRAWRAANREKVKAKDRARYAANPEKVRAQARAWKAANPEKVRAQDRARYAANREKRRDRDRTLYAANREKITAQIRARHATDLQYHLARNLRSRLRQALKGNYKKGSAVRDLGCTIPELQAHLESLWKPGMTWDNWGNKEDCWQIDHIIQLAEVDLTNVEDLQRVCHYTNLRPLWREENLSRPRVKSKTRAAKSTKE